MEALIVTISHKRDPSDEEKYGRTMDLYKQEIPMQWLEIHNPQIVRKIISVCNNLSVTEE